MPSAVAVVFQKSANAALSHRPSMMLDPGPGTGGYSATGGDIGNASFFQKGGLTPARLPANVFHGSRGFRRKETAPVTVRILLQPEKY